VIESKTEISSLEGTSPRETATTSARRVPNTLIADYGREKKIYIYIFYAGILKKWVEEACSGLLWLRIGIGGWRF